MAITKKPLVRCGWVSADPLYQKYHDQEWGVPVYNDKILFEFLLLESAQAGLSWLTVLRKRENYRKAFANFNPRRVAKFTATDIKRLLNDAGIIRNKLKIAAAINNAQRFLEVQKEFGSFSKYIWRFTDGKPIINRWTKLSQLPAKTKLAEVIAVDLKKRGFKFLGPTVIYAHLQATGIINDHLITCFRYKQIKSN